MYIPSAKTGTGMSDQCTLFWCAYNTGTTDVIEYSMYILLSGTLTSITNFASSVSRNMEHLSLDPDHQERQQESRRLRPEGLSQGLRSGFTGLGLSILGKNQGVKTTWSQLMYVKWKTISGCIAYYHVLAFVVIGLELTQNKNRKVLTWTI